jgi:hypothetical protein
VERRLQLPRVEEGRSNNMTNFAKLGVTLCFVSAMAFANRFTGRLIDADCYNRNKVVQKESGHKPYTSITKTCAVTPSTTSFAVKVTGSPYSEDVGTTFKLDDSGNKMAAADMNNGTLRIGKKGRVPVYVHGKVRGETLLTSSIQPRRGRANEVARNQ